MDTQNKTDRTNSLEWLTLSEASKISNKTPEALRMMIRRNKIDRAKKINKERGMIWHIHIDEVNKLTGQSTKQKSFFVYTKKDSPINLNSKEVEPNKADKNDNYVQTNPEHIKKIIKQTIEKTIENQELKLIKPIEQQAMFIAGKLSQENKEIKEKIETILQENEILRNQLKLLPLPVEEINAHINTQLNTIQRLQNTHKSLLKEKKVVQYHIDDLKAENQKLQQEKFFLEKEIKKPWWKKLLRFE